MNKILLASLTIIMSGTICLASEIELVNETGLEDGLIGTSVYPGTVAGPTSEDRITYLRGGQSIPIQEGQYKFYGIEEGAKPCVNNFSQVYTLEKDKKYQLIMKKDVAGCVLDLKQEK